jgi:hypothetical protein
VIRGSEQLAKQQMVSEDLLNQKAKTTRDSSGKPILG